MWGKNNLLKFNNTNCNGHAFFALAIIIFLIFTNLVSQSPVIAPITKSTSPDQKTIVNSIGMEFVLIPSGEVDMGSPSNEAGRDDNEGPIHRVKISNAFYMGKYEVTQKQWRDVMGSSPSSNKGDNLPVESVSWDDIQDFIKKLNENEGVKKYRLPTEAEWEYGARAGTTTRYSFGDDESMLGDYAWCSTNSGFNTHDVGQKKPNPWGLYDMHGNVWEWVQDNFHYNYDGAPADGSSWVGGDDRLRGNRGGCLGGGTVGDCRSAYRFYSVPGLRIFIIGFRLVMVQPTSTNTLMTASTNTPIAQISTPTVIATQQPQLSTSTIDTVPTTYLSYVNGGSGFYQVRNLDKPSRKFIYENSVLNINRGDTVIWENDEVTETLKVISDQKLWDSKIGQIKAGRRINYTFNNPGTYTFHIVSEGISKRQTIVVTQTDSQISEPISKVSSVTTSGDQKTITNSIGMEFVQIPAGEFDMGSSADEKYTIYGRVIPVKRFDQEGPVHRVKISKAFYLGKYEVTQKQWREVMGSNPSDFNDDNLPVVNVSWYDVQEFILKLNQKEGVNKYRLPSEAEWEYAVRAGTNTIWYFGNDATNWDEYIVMAGDRTARPVGQKKPNQWGLYDMYGNVYEWAVSYTHLTLPTIY